jgi:archaellum component FlaF (FlaF/FlaG flagellin family)
MSAQKKKLYSGLVMIIGFFIVLGIIFSPVFNGQNGLDYLDNLYNSISKGSAYYIPAVAKQVEAFNGTQVNLNLSMGSEEQARQTATLLMHSGEMVNVSGNDLKINADLGRMLANCLSDADRMYANQGAAIAGKYGYGERQALYNWYLALKGMNKDLTAQKEFKSAKIISEVNQKAVETAYNYYEIEAQKIGDKLGIVVFSLGFYVVYTLWYGFAVMFLFEGWGMRLSH